MNNKQQLMYNIDKLSFAADDVKLFLDTHPDNTDALDYYEKIKIMRNKAVEEYTNMYGPISAYQVNVSNNSWVRNQGPWPWQIGGC